jgi:hypothetical protein
MHPRLGLTHPTVKKKGALKNIDTSVVTVSSTRTEVALMSLFTCSCFTSALTCNAT